RGDVPYDARKEASVAQEELRDPQLNREVGAILAAGLNLPPDADDRGLARANVIADVRVMLAPEGLGHEHFDVLADDFRLRVSEQFFRGRIEGLDDSSVVDTDDPV